MFSVIFMNIQISNLHIVPLNKRTMSKLQSCNKFGILVLVPKMTHVKQNSLHPLRYQGCPPVSNISIEINFFYTEQIAFNFPSNVVIGFALSNILFD